MTIECNKTKLKNISVALNIKKWNVSFYCQTIQRNGPHFSLQYKLACLRKLFNCIKYDHHPIFNAVYNKQEILWYVISKCQNSAAI